MSQTKEFTQSIQCRMFQAAHVVMKKYFPISYYQRLESNVISSEIFHTSFSPILKAVEYSFVTMLNNFFKGSHCQNISMLRTFDVQCTKVLQETLTLWMWRNLSWIIIIALFAWVNVEVDFILNDIHNKCLNTSLNIVTIDFHHDSSIPIKIHTNKLFHIYV